MTERPLGGGCYSCLSLYRLKNCVIKGVFATVAKLSCVNALRSFARLLFRWFRRCYGVKAVCRWRMAGGRPILVLGVVGFRALRFHGLHVFDDSDLLM